jgi:predicted transcriptional regulator
MILAALLKPQRTELLRYLRNKEEITLDELAKDLHRSISGLNRDLNLLSKYEFVHIVPKSLHDKKRIRPTFTRETLEFVARV